MTLKEQWIAAAKEELKGKDPFETLTKSWDKFLIKPFYDETDRKELISNTNRQGNPFSGANGWLNIIQVGDEPAVNSNAIVHLQAGADGVAFPISTNSQPEFLLKEIKPQFCFLIFESTEINTDFFKRLTEKILSSDLNGALFWGSVQDWVAIAEIFKSYEKFRCFGIHVIGDSVEDKLFDSLSLALKIADELTDFGYNAQTVFNQLAFSVQSTNNFFGDICTIRALRILIDRLAQGYRLNSSSSFIRVVINPAVDQAYQPHGEMLYNSLGVIASVMASADAVTVNSENLNSALHVRTARNISLLLKEESKLDKVIDPLNGSYFIGNLTNQIVETVWQRISKL